MTLTCGSLFSGGGLADVGLRDARFTPIWAVEYDPEIADCYRRNLGDHCLTADVRDVDYGTLTPPDLLWASPSCVRASVANNQRGETQEDMETAGAVCRALEALNPRWFILENVAGYRDFDAFQSIGRCLDRMGYWWHAEVLNSADFGVPQTRRRLILRAVRDSMISPLPDPVPWKGWYEAIADMIDTLPESHFAPFQIDRLPEDVQAFLVRVQGQNGDGNSRPHEPAPTITSGHASGKYRAFLIEPKNIHPNGSVTTRWDSQPSHTVTAVDRPCHVPVAYLVDGKPNSSGSTGDSRSAEEPSFVVAGSHNKQSVRAWLSSGRVVSMTPRALARFQSVPDDYALPERRLACKVVGNGVPCLLAQRIGESLIRK